MTKRGIAFAKREDVEWVSSAATAASAPYSLVYLFTSFSPSWGFMEEEIRC